MKKEITTVGATIRKTGIMLAFSSLFLLGACEAKKPADQEAKDRDDAATDITEDADPDSTVESPATTGYLAQPTPSRV
ncbi:hypothetical protein [Rufibacter hautae]|uniref:Uncharacterized protein n=1 Tax=Rufibacter hautae TaxID=2595005 RepID=A0A5B6TLF0_9BACT|nr:hypothetical protein [Rufibacter hautae]KAA3440217.1 hypothetical protein FOA19_06025 [Rufibacter hautae]